MRWLFRRYLFRIFDYRYRCFSSLGLFRAFRIARRSVDRDAFGDVRRPVNDSFDDLSDSVARRSSRLADRSFSRLACYPPNINCSAAYRIFGSRKEQGYIAALFEEQAKPTIQSAF